MPRSITSEQRPGAVRDAIVRPAIALTGVTKSYRIYGNPALHMVDALGVGWLPYVRRRPRPEFVALDTISLRIERGEKVGIVGRNGAGKTTLLKLVSGVIEPTGGEVFVDGSVQALMQVGVGFHLEMSGIENVHGALIYNGLAGDELRQAIDEVVEFAELGDYLERPLRTYSLGMKARLQFATATAIRPSILVIDEILGAGDAYFAVKSAERMRKLMGGGCTLLLVSHSMPQLHQFCERVVWIERGRIIADSDPLSVINAYEEFIARYQMAAERHSAAGGKGGVPEWLREKLARESLSAVELIGGDATAVRGNRAGARWEGPGPLRISEIQLLGPDRQPTDRLGMSGPFGIAVKISTELPGTYPCTTIVFIYHEHGHTITRAATVDDALTLAEDGTARRIAWFDRNFLGNGRYVVSAGLYRSFDVGAPQAAERYDILSKAAHFEVAALPNDPSLVRIAPTWLSA